MNYIREKKNEGFEREGCKNVKEWKEKLGIKDLVKGGYNKREI